MKINRCCCCFGLFISFSAVFFRSRTIETHVFIRDYNSIPSSNFFDDEMNRCVVHQAELWRNKRIITRSIVHEW